MSTWSDLIGGPRAEAGSGSTHTITTTTAGSGKNVVIFGGQGNPSAASITDSASHTWTNVVTRFISGHWLVVAYYDGTLASGTVITCTITGATSTIWVADAYYSTSVATGAADVAVSSNAAAGSQPSQAFTTTIANEDLLGVCHVAGGETFTTPSGWTQDGYAADSTHHAIYVAEQTQATAGAGTFAPTMSDTSNACATIVVGWGPATGSPQTLLVGKVSTGVAVRGVNLDQTVHVGKVATGVAVRGANLAGTNAATLLVGKVASAVTVRGANLAGAGAVSLLVGHVATGVAVRGANLTPSPVSLLVGHISSAVAVRGANLAPSGHASLLVGHVSTAVTVHGANLAASGHATLLAGHVASGQAVRGVNLIQTIHVGKVSSSQTVRGVTLAPSGHATLSVGKVATGVAVRGAVLCHGDLYLANSTQAVYLGLSDQGVPTDPGNQLSPYGHVALIESLLGRSFVGGRNNADFSKTDSSNQADYDGTAFQSPSQRLIAYLMTAFTDTDVIPTGGTDTSTHKYALNYQDSDGTPSIAGGGLDNAQPTAGATSPYYAQNGVTPPSVPNVVSTWSTNGLKAFLNLLLAEAGNGRWTTVNPLILSPQHEQIVQNSVQPRPANGNAGLADYVLAYRHLRDLADTLGVTKYKKDGTWNGGNVVFAWIPTHNQWLGPMGGQSIDGQGATGTHGAVTNGSTAFTDTHAAFTSADTGKAIWINGAGPGGAGLVTTITYVSATAVTLAHAASTTVSGATYTYGVDWSATNCDPNGTANGQVTAAPAGTCYWDLAGTDLYNKYQGSVGSRTLKLAINNGDPSGTDPLSIFTIISDYAAAQGKQWMIGEYGCEDNGDLGTTDHTNKATFVASTAAAIKSFGALIPGSCYAWMLTSTQGTVDERINSSTQSINAFKAMATDPFFTAGLPPADFLLPGKVASSQVVRGANLAGSGAASLLVGHVPSGQAVRGANLTPSPVTMLVGKVSSTQHVYGVQLQTQGAPLPVGKIASSQAVRGANLTPASAAPLLAGKVTHSSTVRGANLTPGPVTMHAGRVSSTVAVRGVTLTPGPVTFPVGKVSHSSTVRGANLTPGPVTLATGKVSSSQTVRGVTIAAAGAALVFAGKIASSQTVHGANVVNVGVPLAYLGAEEDYTGSVGAPSETGGTIGTVEGTGSSIGNQEGTTGLVGGPEGVEGVV